MEVCSDSFDLFLNGVAFWVKKSSMLSLSLISFSSRRENEPIGADVGAGVWTTCCIGAGVGVNVGAGVGVSVGATCWFVTGSTTIFLPFFVFFSEGVFLLFVLKR